MSSILVKISKKTLPEGRQSLQHSSEVKDEGMKTEYALPVTADTGDILSDLKEETIRTERITITSVHTRTSAKTCDTRICVTSLCHSQEDS